MCLFFFNVSFGESTIFNLLFQVSPFFPSIASSFFLSFEKMVGPRKERPSKRGAGGEGLKDPSTALREHVVFETVGLEGYRSMINQEDLSPIQGAYASLRSLN